MFKKILASLGAGSASIETVLHNAQVQPGGVIQGVTHLKGGSVDQDINAVSVALMARVEVESGDQEYTTDMTFTKLALTGKFELDDGQEHDIPFNLEVPWESPITSVTGQPLRGMAVGVSTHLDIAGAIDQGDLDPVQIRPLPAQEMLLDAFVQLGMRFKRADLERGHIRGTAQTLPFYQEIEFAPGPQFPRLNELEVTFITGPRQMEVVLEADKRHFGGNSDTFQKFVVEHGSANQRNWQKEISQLLKRMGG